MTRCKRLALLVAVALSPILPLLAQTTGDRSMARTLTATEARNMALVEAGFAAWSSGAGSPFELLADDATWAIVGRSDARRSIPARQRSWRK